MALEDLVVALETAAGEVGGPPAWLYPSGHTLFLPRLAYRIGNGELASDLMRILGAAPELEPIRGKLYLIGTSWEKTSLPYLAARLIRRTLESNAEQAVRELEAYVGGSPFNVMKYLVVDGVKVNQEFELADGVKVGPESIVPLPEFQPPPPPAQGTLSMPRAPTWRCALVKTEQQTPQWRARVGQADVQLSFFTDIEDAQLCLTLFSPTHTHLSNSGYIVIDQMPFRESSGTSYQVPSTFWWKRHTTLSRRQLGKLATVHRQFVGMSEPDKVVLRTSLDRLNTAMGRERLVDSAIDLGIALESLLSKLEGDPNTEVGYRISLRAARYIGGNLDKRRDTVDKVKEIYTLRSDAAHGGKFSKRKRAKAKEHIESGYVLARDILMKVIADGRRDWERVELAP